MCWQPTIYHRLTPTTHQRATVDQVCGSWTLRTTITIRVCLKWITSMNSLWRSRNLEPSANNQMVSWHQDWARPIARVQGIWCNSSTMKPRICASGPNRSSRSVIWRPLEAPLELQGYLWAQIAISRSKSLTKEVSVAVMRLWRNSIHNPAAERLKNRTNSCRLWHHNLQKTTMRFKSIECTHHSSFTLT